MNATLQPIEVSNLARPVWVETLMPETGRQHQRPIPGAQGRTSNDAMGQPHTSRRIRITTAPISKGRHPESTGGLRAKKFIKHSKVFI